MATQDYRTIVVGIDGSQYAGPTATRAARIAAKAGAGLVIVCAWSATEAQRESTYISAHDSRTGVVFGRDTAKQALKSAVKIALKKSAIVEQALLVESDAAAALLTVAAQQGADLIVLGAARRTGVVAKLLGSVASDVIGGADCDVLLVRTPESDTPETGTVPVDFTGFATETIRIPRRA